MTIFDRDIHYTRRRHSRFNRQAAKMFFYLAIIYLVVLESNAQETCWTVSRTQGDCVNINECPSLLSLLMQPRPLPEESLNTLSRSHCGFLGSTPKVCCPRNSQPLLTTPPPTSVRAQFPNVTNHPNVRLLDYHICGPYNEERIIGGNKTGIFEFPWMALISYNVQGKPNPEFKCGGTLISKRYVLTAAHCVTGLFRGNTLRGVRLGEHDLSKERDCEITMDGESVCTDGYQDFLSESVSIHSGYSREKLRNDIALIRLNRDANFRANVYPICLPIGSTATLANRKVKVTGWGVTETGRRSEDLLVAKLPIVPIAECTDVYKPHKVNLWYKQLCAGGSNRTDSCSGDSGGPMQVPAVYLGQIKYFQYGIVSFGPRVCAVEGLPGVYTNVAHYMDWILDNMSD